MLEPSNLHLICQILHRLPTIVLTQLAFWPKDYIPIALNHFWQSDNLPRHLLISDLFTGGFGTLGEASSCSSSCKRHRKTEYRTVDQNFTVFKPHTSRIVIPVSCSAKICITGVFLLFLPGLSHLVGSSLLRAYMHGFFMDIRLYHKVGCF